MIFDIKKIGMTAMIALSLLCTSPTQLSAQFFGGGGGIGRLANILRDILDQAETIADAAQTIIENGNFGDLAPLVPEIQQVLQLLDQAETISFNVETVIADFEEIFPENFNDFDLFETVTSINDANESTRESIERALEIGANAVQSQLPTTIRTEAIRTVGTAAGPAAALQAIVNLQSEQIGQFSRLQTLLVSQGRVLSLQATETETARKRSRRLRELDDPTVFATDEPQGIELGLDLLD